jgi:hypothetical protein
MLQEDGITHDSMGWEDGGWRAGSCVYRSTMLQEDGITHDSMGWEDGGSCAIKCAPAHDKGSYVGGVEFEKDMKRGNWVTSSSTWSTSQRVGGR